MSTASVPPVQGSPLPLRPSDAQHRPWLARLVVFSPCLLILGVDLHRRAAGLRLFTGWQPLYYVGSLLESALLWGALLSWAVAARRLERALAALLFSLAFTLSLGSQSYFWEQYRTYLNLDVSLFAQGLLASVGYQLAADLRNYLAALGPYCVASLLGLALATRLAPRRARSVGRARAAALAATALALLLPVHHRNAQAATPDTLYFNALGGLARSLLGLTPESEQLRPRERASLPVARLEPRLPAPRNVVLLLLESVRADAVCSSYAPECGLTAATNQLLPGRVGLTQLRAQSSTTAISLAVLWTGLAPTESRDLLHTYPLLFDYARAAGYDTAYFTSQNLMFGNSRLWVAQLGTSKLLSATELDPAADLDLGAREELLVTRVGVELETLREPYFAVVHLSNTHYPYRVEQAAPQPFQPARLSKAPEDGAALRNYYQNAVYQQDLNLAELVRVLRRGARGQRTVLLLTSDHGEAFREHGQMGHTFSVLDEEVKVPGWVDAPPGTLSPEERRHLESKAESFTFHADVVPTVLDLLGVWDDPGLEPFKPKLLGTSWLRAPHTRAALPMTNCAGVWSCAFDNWGYMREHLKLEARAWDGRYRCWDLARDPSEERELPASACGDLEQRARATFPYTAGRRPK